MYYVDTYIYIIHIIYIKERRCQGKKKGHMMKSGNKEGYLSLWKQSNLENS